MKNIVQPAVDLRLRKFDSEADVGDLLLDHERSDEAWSQLRTRTLQLQTIQFEPFEAKPYLGAGFQILVNVPFAAVVVLAVVLLGVANLLQQLQLFSRVLSWLRTAPDRLTTGRRPPAMSLTPLVAFILPAWPVYGCTGAQRGL